MQVSKIVEGVSSANSDAVSALQNVFKMLTLEVDDQVFPAAYKMLFLKLQESRICYKLEFRFSGGSNFCLLAF